MTLNPKYTTTNSDQTYHSLFELLRKIGKTSHIAKGSVILQEGNDCSFFFLVEEGVFRAYRWINDTEVTVGFSFMGDIDTCPYSFFHNVPSLDIIEALTDSKVTIVKKKDFDSLLADHPEFQNFIQRLLSNYIEILIQRLIDIKINSAEHNYAVLINRQPNEVQNIPLMYVASYLGISQERLSRIRKKYRIDLDQM